MANDILWVVRRLSCGDLSLHVRRRQAQGAHGLLSAAGRDAGETDAHILMTKYLGAALVHPGRRRGRREGVAVHGGRAPLGRVSVGWLAAVGVLLVAGHAFPFYATRMAGRGLSATAGVLLVVLPWEMVVAGTIIAIGVLARHSGIASTVGLATVPLVAALQGQPPQFVVMGAAIFVLIMVRRLQGVRAVAAAGTSHAEGDPVPVRVRFERTAGTRSRPVARG